MKPYGYWNDKERCHKVALKCKTRAEFQNKYPSALHAAERNGWIDKILSHMKQVVHWTKEKCHKEALKCKSRGDFRKKCSGGYNSAWKNNWLDDICSHMIKKIPKWTKDKCHKVALKCKSRREFSIKYGSAYFYARINNWLDEICSHMIKIGNRFRRCIYAFEFPDNSVYVGLTYNITERKKSHFKNIKSSVNKHIQKTGLQPELKQLTDYIDINLASIKEGKFVEQYKKNGWNILNESKTGTTGGDTLIWTKEKCHIEALKYDTRRKFLIGSASAYNRARQEGWLNDICSHMIEIYKPKNFWTKKRIHEVALKCKTRTEFNDKYGSAYGIACNNNWLDDVCFHMHTKKVNQKNHWTKKEIQKVALKCNTRVEFEIKYSGAYGAASKNGWLVEICSHIVRLIKQPGYWTKKRIHEVALKCKTRKYFQNKYSSAHQIACRKGWLDDVCSHMKQVVHWTKEKCHKEALKCKTRTEFRDKYGRAYSAARKHGWFKDICFHMIERKIFWTKKEIQKVALKCNTRAEFQDKYSRAYEVSRQNNWLNEICYHMFGKRIKQ